MAKSIANTYYSCERHLCILQLLISLNLLLHVFLFESLALLTDYFEDSTAGNTPGVLE